MTNLRPLPRRGPGRPPKPSLNVLSSALGSGAVLDLFVEPPQNARDRLLTATHELLVERIRGPVSLSEICARAGLNAALVKYYFGNKDGLLSALHSHIRAQLRADIERLDRSDRTPTEKLAVYIDHMVRLFARYPYLAYILHQEHGDEEIAHFVEEWLRPALDWFARLVAEGRKRGEFRDVDPRFLMFSIAGACEFLFVVPSWTEVAFDEPMLSERMVDAFVEHTKQTVLRGIAGKPTRKRRYRKR
ncbi:MAG: TetR/AcrR family transcriptional regulator [Candidatus Binatia bacterium]